MRKSYVKKYLAVAVILLFIGVAFAPCINANISKEMVEFTTEICGLNGGKQTAKLTQKEAEEVEALFDSIRERLNATATREEAEKIFREAVVELDEYGLLGGLSVKQAQRFLSFNNAIQRYNSISEMSENENAFCLISGEVTNAYFFGPIARYIISFWEWVGLEWGGFYPFIISIIGVCNTFYT